MDDLYKKKIIIIEDEPDVLLYLQSILEDSGFNVLTAGDGETGLKLIREHRPDLISLDLVLPKMSGRKVLRVLKKDEALSRIPVLIVTAHADDDLGNPTFDSIWRPRCLDQGAGMFLHKPVKPLEYVRCIEQALGIESKAESKLRLSVKSELEDLARHASPEALKAALEVLRKG